MINKVIIKQAFRFGVVGGISTIVNYGVYYVLYQFIGLHYQIASAIGFITGVFVGYGLNKYWTFESHEKQSAEIAKYFGVYIASLLLSLGFLYVCVEVIKISANIANLFAICLTTMTNFLGTKFLVFRA
ncbi:MAG: GtrA family protein [Cytophagales bacterium]|nr:GtrA family protein [Cytophagales bacterium]MDW8385190.1 GtrA family protein [Flammeovirgaceae bacterium]